jgi:hypothetical protein
LCSCCNIEMARLNVGCPSGGAEAHGGPSVLKIDPIPPPCERIRAGVHMGRKIMNRRTLTTMVLLGLAVATAFPQIACAQTDPFLGTWQLNLAKSKYSPGPPHRPCNHTKPCTNSFSKVGTGRFG